MKSTGYKKIIIDFICILYIILFVYAGVSKVLDYENFRVQIGQSPLLSAFAGVLAWLVPATEIIISFLLLFSRTKVLALFSGYTLMIMFTAYIYILLNFSSYTPCSCGGILEKMGWNTHLLFNLFFVILAAIAIVLQSQIIPIKTHRNEKI